VKEWEKIDQKVKIEKKVSTEGNQGGVLAVVKPSPGNSWQSARNIAFERGQGAAQNQVVLGNEGFKHA